MALANKHRQGRSNSLGAKAESHIKRSNSYIASQQLRHSNPNSTYYAIKDNTQIGHTSDFNSGSGALKKQWAPGNASQQNPNPFGTTDRGFKPTQPKKNALGKPPVPGGKQISGFGGNMLPPLPSGKLPA